MELRTVASLAEVVADEHIERIAVDIPIGLLDRAAPGGRSCDAAARFVRGVRTSSVFSPPARIALGARSYDEAKTLCPMSRQSYGLLKKINEVDALVTPATQDRVFETHPEVAFAALGEDARLSSKKTPRGRAERLAALAPLLDGVDQLARRRERGLGVDDILDSVVAAVVAARRATGYARRLPGEPAADARGLRMEIWY